MDIFFVISGFLISTIIFQNLDRNSFSFSEFYSRRIRRIFPALVVVLMAVYGIGWFTLLADEYGQLGKHLAGGAGFISNFVFWAESGYFDNAAETKPLLHLWSLGIEEQFYLVWPLLLWAGWKLRFNLLTVIGSVALISFLINVSKVFHDPVAAFYSPQARFWELLVGSALAYATLHDLNHASFPRVLPQRLWSVGVSSIVGASLIGFSLLLITRQSVFPGWWAVLPTVGSALIISAGPKAWLNRVVLSSRVLVWCGLISFPIYLWHWPLLAFPRIVNGLAPPAGVRISAVMISILLAWMTYKFVERPLRFGTNVKAIVTGLMVFILFIGAVGYLTYRHDGLTSRWATKPEVRNEGDITHALFHQYAAAHFYPCTPLSIRQAALTWEGALRCLQSKADKPIDVAIVGDSHAEQLFLGLAEQFGEYNIAYYIKTTLPVISDPEFKTVYRYVLSDNNIKTVIISSYWYVKQAMVPKGSSLQAELSSTVEALGALGKKVILTDDVPNFPFDPKNCKYSRRFSRTNYCVQASEFFNGQRQTYYPSLQYVARTHSNVTLLDIPKYFCNSQTCSMANAGHILYRDNQHLNLDGTRYLAKKIAADNPQLLAFAEPGPTPLYDGTDFQDTQPSGSLGPGFVTGIQRAKRLGLAIPAAIGPCTERVSAGAAPPSPQPDAGRSPGPRPHVCPYFGPDAVVTRAEMAYWIVRAQVDEAQITKYLCATGGDPSGLNQCGGAIPASSFGDLGAAGGSIVNPFLGPSPALGIAGVSNLQLMRYIEVMIRLGYSKGCGSSNEPVLRYCPNNPVTRAEMSVFVVRGSMNQLLPLTLSRPPLAAPYGNNPRAAPAPYFSDVKPDDPVYRPYYLYIQKMGELGIAKGTRAPIFSPGSNVTRKEIAAFVEKAFSL